MVVDLFPWSVELHRPMARRTVSPRPDIVRKQAPTIKAKYFLYRRIAFANVVGENSNIGTKIVCLLSVSEHLIYF